MNLLKEIIRNNLKFSGKDYQDFLESQFEANDKQRLTALLTALSAKPLELADIVNFVQFIERKTPRRSLSFSDRAVNIVGTGGGISTFNISTTAALVAAAAGATVIKSGSSSYNGSCGSLDLLGRLGIKPPISEQGLEAMVEELNIGFVHPNMYSPLLRRLAVSILPLSLREIGGFINTVGPLLCPFHVYGQICGVRSYRYVQIFSNALLQLGMTNSLAVWSELGMDEFSAIGINHLSMVHDTIERQTFNPLDHDMDYNDETELNGGTADENAAKILRLLKTGNPGAARDTVVANAAFMLLIADKANSIEDAIAACRQVIADQSAYRLLNRAIEFSQNLDEQEAKICQIGKVG